MYSCYFRANLFFCGKRKRSHRDRYLEQHSSSVPRQRDFFGPNKNSYMEYRSRNRSFSKPCERILPLHKSIVSKIERIAQGNREKISGFQFMCLHDVEVNSKPVLPTLPLAPFVNQPQVEAVATVAHKMAQKSGSFESTLNPLAAVVACPTGRQNSAEKKKERRQHKNSKRLQKQKLQFEDPEVMDCDSMNEYLENLESSSSSLSSSSDSEAAETNDSDREGDDELTDWPGNEAMVNFTSKNDFKRAKPRTSIKTTLPQIKSDDLAQDDDTLMSADELMATSQTSMTPNTQQQQQPPLPPNTLNLSVRYSPAASLADVVPLHSTMPIDILENHVLAGVVCNQIESEQSGETSNHFLSSPNTNEVREIRAGCRRIRNERPGFTILTSVNEELSKYAIYNCITIINSM